MLGNHLKLAVRNLGREKLYAVLNLAGLSIGIASALLIAVYVVDELSYDRFHEQGDRIYRVLHEDLHGKVHPRVEPRVSGGIGPALQAEDPAVEDFVRFAGLTAEVWVRHEDKVFDLVVRTVDPQFLTVFSFPLVRGDRATALRDPYSIVMTESAARQFFGDEDPIGKGISCEDLYFKGDYTVTGVLKDLAPQSSIRVDMVTATVSPGFQSPWSSFRGSATWRPLQTYVLLKEGADPAALEKRLPALLARHMDPESASGMAYRLQPLRRIHLYSGADFGMTQDFGLIPYGDIDRVGLLAAVGVLVIVLACTNYTNLATARSTGRAREMGVRLAAGAHRGQLLGQFLTESCLLALAAGAVGLTLAEIALPWLEGVTGKTLALDPASWWPGVTALALVVGLLSGLYPALLCSSVRPAVVLKGDGSTDRRGALLRKGLVVVQFGLTAALLVTTGTVRRQLRFISERRLGYDPDCLVSVPIYGMDRKVNERSPNLLALRYEVVKEAALAHPAVLKASAIRWDMGAEGAGGTQVVLADGQPFDVRIQEADPDYVDTFGMKLVAGQGFSLDRPAELRGGFLVNETAARVFGWTEPLGRPLSWGRAAGKVIGVVADYNDRSLHEPIAPTLVVYRERGLWSLVVRLDRRRIEDGLHHLGGVWKRFLPDRPFMYSFVEEDVATLYAAERRLGRLATAFSGLALLVACLGLFGLASLTTEQRRREIGIRKVVGASSGRIAATMSAEFLKLVAIANLVALPAGYAVGERWLEQFAYRANQGAEPYVLAAALTLIISLAAVSTQALRAARTDPVRVLRSE